MKLLVDKTEREIVVGEKSQGVGEEEGWVVFRAKICLFYCLLVQGILYFLEPNSRRLNPHFEVSVGFSFPWIDEYFVVNVTMKVEGAKVFSGGGQNTS